MYTLYGDGVHDDTAAIQEMIDSGRCEVVLPIPEKFYLISKPLELPSNFRLVLPRFAEIRLADGSNCVMIRNKMVKDHANRLEETLSDLCKHIWGYIDDYSPDAPCENIELRGGIWNCNNMGQRPNPEQIRDFSIREFIGAGMLFYNIKNLKISSLTVKDPTNYGMNLEKVSYFTVEDITFDYNLGNPLPINMDGIHCNGNCHYGVIRNLKGACYDDLVALNAEEGMGGDITNIEIDGIFAEDCHSAVRLLAVKARIENVHISNVYGTYYQYCIGITKYYKGDTTGGFNCLTLDNIYASKAVRTADVYPWPSSYVFAPIHIDSHSYIRSLTVRTMHRNEYNDPIYTLRVGGETVIERLILDGITTENHTGEPMALLHNEGIIRCLSMKDVYVGADEPIENVGRIESIEIH